MNNLKYTADSQIVPTREQLLAAARGEEVLLANGQPPAVRTANDESHDLGFVVYGMRADRATPAWRHGLRALAARCVALAEDDDVTLNDATDELSMRLADLRKADVARRKAPDQSVPAFDGAEMEKAHAEWRRRERLG